MTRFLSNSANPPAHLQPGVLGVGKVPQGHAVPSPCPHRWWRCRGGDAELALPSPPSRYRSRGDRAQLPAGICDAGGTLVRPHRAAGWDVNPSPGPGEVWEPQGAPLASPASRSSSVLVLLPAFKASRSGRSREKLPGHLQRPSLQRAGAISPLQHPPTHLLETEASIPQRSLHFPQDLLPCRAFPAPQL